MRSMYKTNGRPNLERVEKKTGFNITAANSRSFSQNIVIAKNLEENMTAIVQDKTILGFEKKKRQAGDEFFH